MPDTAQIEGRQVFSYPLAMSDQDPNPFAIEPGEQRFESLAHENGFRFWWASDLAKLLGYEDLSSFRKSVQKAMQVCIGLNVDVTDNVEAKRREIDGRSFEDYKLSRFACYLAAMNGDVRKPEVAQAQAYFVTFAEACRLALTEADGVARVQMRGDVSEGERSLSGTAKRAGVSEYGLFQNAGYRGLYNMNLSRLKQLKHVPKSRSPLDFMGKAELAANLFRITQTDEKIRSSGIRGQARCEQAAEEVGARVRQTMLETGGRAPENLRPAKDIKEVQKQIKSTQRGFKKIDGTPKPPKEIATIGSGVGETPEPQH
jgi:DNA-damage-inducible protein D